MACHLGLCYTGRWAVGPTRRPVRSDLAPSGRLQRHTGSCSASFRHWKWDGIRIIRCRMDSDGVAEEATKDRYGEGVSSHMYDA